MLICAAVSTSGQQRSACPVDLTSPTLVPVSLRPAAPGCGRDTMHGAPALSEMAQVGQIDAFCPHLTTRSCCLASPSGGGISMNSVLQMTLRNWAMNPLANLAQARARTRAYCFQTRFRREERWQRTPDTDRATQRTACNVQHPAVRIIAPAPCFTRRLQTSARCSEFMRKAICSLCDPQAAQYLQVCANDNKQNSDKVVTVLTIMVLVMVPQEHESL
jgi:hypothetical protein